MPTSELLPDFHRDYAKLNEAQKKAFRLAVTAYQISIGMLLLGILLT